MFFVTHSFMKRKVRKNRWFTQFWHLAFDPLYQYLTNTYAAFYKRIILPRKNASQVSFLERDVAKFERKMRSKTDTALTAALSKLTHDMQKLEQRMEHLEEARQKRDEEIEALLQKILTKLSS